MKYRREDEVGRLDGAEREQFQNVMKSRRAFGKKFEAMTGTYVSALGEFRPSISIVGEDTFLQSIYMNNVAIWIGIMQLKSVQRLICI
jgi:hypothetical protein